MIKTEFCNAHFGFHINLLVAGCEFFWWYTTTTTQQHNNRPLQELNKVKSAFQCSCVEAGVPFVFVLSIETNNGICDSFIAVTSVCNGKNALNMENVSGKR